MILFGVPGEFLIASQWNGRLGHIVAKGIML